MSGSLHPKDVKIPGVLVDCVVVSTPEHHSQTWGTQYSPAMSGELRVPLSSMPPLELSVRKVIARRAAMELRPNAVVNLGIGIPEGIASVAAEEHVLSYIILTAEPGVIGGMPTGGGDFGSAINGDAILEQPAQFDFYDGGGLDAAFLGMAQADARGNVNVSRFGPKLAGSGGFINISQNAKKVVFLGTFLAPCRTEVVDGRTRRHRRGGRAEVPRQMSSSAPSAASTPPPPGQPVLYVTERCVFRLTPDGLELIEIAPGIDLEKGRPGPCRLHPDHRRRAETDGREAIPRRAHGSQGRSADRTAGCALHLRRRPQHLLHQYGRRVGVHRRRGRGHRRRDREEVGRGRQEGSRRGQLRQLLPRARPRRHVHVRGPQPCRTLLRKRHPLHHQLIHASQAQRPSHRAWTGPTHLRKPPRSTRLAQRTPSGAGFG